MRRGRGHTDDRWRCLDLVRECYTTVGIELPDPGKDVGRALAAKRDLFTVVDPDRECVAVGDLLVWRDAEECAAHVALVIEPGGPRSAVNLSERFGLHRTDAAHLIEYQADEVIRYDGPDRTALDR